MSRKPSVIVQVTKDAFLPDLPTAETRFRGNYGFSAGILLKGLTLIHACGTTSEVGNTYMSVPSLSNWWSRLSSNQGNGAGYTFAGFGASAGQGGALYPEVSPGGTGNTFNQVRWPQGATGEWKTPWWTVHNYLKYGGGAVVGAQNSSPFITDIVPMQVAFAGDADGLDQALYTFLNNDLLTNRGSDLQVILGATAKDAVPWDGSAGGGQPADRRVYTYGDKQIIPLGSNEDAESESGYITTPLTADLAGCMARTFRVAAPWASPAGFARGRILDVFRIPDPLTAREQDELLSNNINPIIYFENQGHVLFGDLTSDRDGNNIPRTQLFIYLESQIGNIARSSLFEKNDTQTRQSFINRSTSILNTMKNRGAISTYTVACNGTNNTEAVVNAGEFVADVYIKPITGVEEIQLTFTNSSQSATYGA